MPGFRHAPPCVACASHGQCSLCSFAHALQPNADYRRARPPLLPAGHRRLHGRGHLGLAAPSPGDDGAGSKVPSCNRGRGRGCTNFRSQCQHPDPILGPHISPTSNGPCRPGLSSGSVPSYATPWPLPTSAPSWSRSCWPASTSSSATSGRTASWTASAACGAGSCGCCGVPSSSPPPTPSSCWRCPLPRPSVPLAPTRC